MQRLCDLGAPGDVRAMGRNQDHGKDEQPHSGRIEDMRASSFPHPLDVLLGHHPDGNHDELQKEPVIPKP